MPFKVQSYIIFLTSPNFLCEFPGFILRFNTIHSVVLSALGVYVGVGVWLSVGVGVPASMPREYCSLFS